MTTTKNWLGWLPGMTYTTADNEPPRATTPEANSHISVTNELGDRPAFKRTYKARLSQGRAITITARTTFSGRNYSGELTQPGGRWVLFDPERVADKIIDPALVAPVMEICRAALSMDDAYVASRPREFVDEGGTTWRRV
jgi:hypothetical protein